MPDGFEWDKEKAALVKSDRGISFEEAATVFDDMNVVTEPDYAHSDFEQRFFAFGVSAAARLLTVIYTERGDSIRIVTVWESPPGERDHYNEANQVKRRGN